MMKLFFTTIFALIFTASAFGAEGGYFMKKPALNPYDAETMRAYEEAKTEDAKLKILADAAQNEKAGAALIFNLAGLLAANGRFEDAAAYYTKALKIEPDFFLAQKNLGMCLINAGKKEEAFKELAKASALAGGSDANVLAAMASISFERGENSAALACLNQALMYEPSNANLLLAKGGALLRLNQSAEAADIFEVILKKDGASAAAWDGLFIARLQNAENARALAVWEAFNKAAPDSAPKRAETAADLSLNLGLYERAKDIYIDALSAGGLSSASKADNVARAFLGAQAYLECVQFCAKAENSASNSDYKAAIVQSRAEALYALGKNAEAQVLCEELLKSGSAKPRTHFLAARIYAQNGEDARAAAAFEAACADDSLALNARLLKARSLINLGDYAGALASLEAAQKISYSENCALLISGIKKNLKAKDDLEKPSR